MGTYYNVTIEAYNNFGQCSVSEPEEVKVMLTPKIEDTKIKESDRGLEIVMDLYYLIQ